MSWKREGSTLYANWRGDGVKMAAKYAAFRYLFSVHSLPVAWLLNRLSPYPILLEIETSTACDLRCTMCELSLGHKRWGQPAKLMPYDDIVKVLDQFPALIWYDCTGIGEPLLHPRFLDMVGEAKRRGLYTECFDHMGNWDEDVTDFIIDHKLNRVQPSVDGATKETYESIRRGASFETMCHNIRYLFAEKKRRGTHLPIVDFHMIVQEANIHEMPDFVNLVRSLAGDQRVGIQFTEVLREIDGLDAKKVPIDEAWMRVVEERAKSLGVQVWFNRNSEGRPKADMRQCNAWHMPFITVEGFVYPCCAQNERGDRKWQNDRSMGNIFKQSFKEIWNGPRYTELRRKMRKGETPDFCEKCPVFESKEDRAAKAAAKK